MKCMLWVEPYLKKQNGCMARPLATTKHAALDAALRPATVERCGGELRADVRAYTDGYSGHGVDVDFRCARCGAMPHGVALPNTLDDVNAALTAFVARIRRWKPKGGE